MKGVKYKSKVFGEVYIGDGIIFIESCNMIWDRNMLLMFKDTATARFHTLFAIEHRTFQKSDRQHLPSVAKMYQLGDKVLAHSPTSAYEVYGLIELISSLLLSRKANTHRPFMREFPHFAQHVGTRIQELSKENAPSREFLQLLINLDNKNLLLSVYGYFRHWGQPFVKYLEGLQALHDNVTSTDLPINKASAEILASDLAFEILDKEYQAKRKWYVDMEERDPMNPLYEHVKNSTWPSINVLIAYPAEWHKLPLQKCWEVPEVVDPIF